jgi:hypothetical protein
MELPELFVETIEHNVETLVREHCRSEAACWLWGVVTVVTVDTHDDSLQMIQSLECNKPCGMNQESFDSLRARAYQATTEQFGVEYDIGISS